MKDIFNKIFDPKYNYIKGTVSIVLGALLIIFPGHVTALAIRVVGIVLIALATPELIIAYKVKKADSSLNRFADYLALNGAGQSVLGLVLLLLPGVILHAAVYALAIGMLVFGGLRIYEYASQGVKEVSPYIIPALVVVLALSLLGNPTFLTDMIFVLMGIALVVYGVSTFVTIGKINDMVKGIEDKLRDSTPDEQ